MTHRSLLHLAALALLFASVGGRLTALEFRTLSWSGSLDGLVYEWQGRLVPLVAGERDLSSTYVLPDGASLRIHRHAPANGSPSPGDREPLLETTPPPGLTKAILMLAREREGGALQALWIDDSEHAHPKGRLAFINLSGSDIAIRADDTTHMVPRQETRLHAFLDGASSVNMQAAVERAGRPEFVASCALRVHPDYKILVLFRDGRPDSGSLNPDYVATSVEFLLFYDYMPRPPVSG